MREHIARPAAAYDLLTAACDYQVIFVDIVDHLTVTVVFGKPQSLIFYQGVVVYSIMLGPRDYRWPDRARSGPAIIIVKKIVAHDLTRTFHLHRHFAFTCGWL